MFEGNTEKRLLEKCAQLATWHFLENDPVEKERLAAELAQCVKEAAKAKEEKKASAAKMAQIDKKKEQQEAKEKAEIQARDAEAAEHAEWEKGMLERAERGREDHGAAPEKVLERTLVIPEYIRNCPAYQQVLEGQRAAQAERIEAEARANNYQGIANQARMEAAEERNEHQQHEAEQDQAKPGVEADDYDLYEQAAKELDAEPMKEGQEIEGEVVEVAQVDGKNYYIIEQGWERLAVPAGDKPEYEKGDEITVSRSKEGFETGESYGYER
jgi:hypothetical protein